MKVGAEDPHKSVYLHTLRTILLMIVLLHLWGCSVSDDRDICCDRVTVTYRYVRTFRDEYLTHIHSERRFLFDRYGLLIRELPVSPAHRQRVTLPALPPGRYTIVAIGNATASGSDLHTLLPRVTHLEELTLALREHSGHQGGDRRVMAPAEKLYWSTLTFDRGHVGERKDYIADMSNIHCHLHLIVEWARRPPRGERRMTVRLSHLYGTYLLVEDPHSRLVIVGKRGDGTGSAWVSTPSFIWHAFPQSVEPPQSVVEVEGSLRGDELHMDLVTLRYRREALPTLQLIHEGRPLFARPIDLAPLFEEWGWQIDRMPEQIYRLRIRILSDEESVVTPEVKGDIMDWEDGGLFAF